MMDPSDDIMANRETVLEIVLSGQHISSEVYELRYSLFLRAVNVYFEAKDPRELIEPFPSCFYDISTKSRRYDELRLCVSNLPDINEIKEMTEETSLPQQTWALIRWIFTNPLKIKCFKLSEISEYLTQELREETKLFSIPYPSSASNRFQIIHQDASATKIFLAHKGEFGSFFAYHGSPGFNFHSIIHRGLRCSLNVRSAYGPGTYLTSYLETAASYANQYHDGLVRAGRTQNDRIKYCVAIVEVIKHPSIVIKELSNHVVNNVVTNKFADTSSNHHRFYVVNSDELMRLRHLLVFY